VKGVLTRGFNGQRLGLAHQRDADAELVGATWEAIGAHAGESPRLPARYVIGVATYSPAALVASPTHVSERSVVTPWFP